MIEIKDVYKIYKMGEHEVRALNGVSLKIEDGDFVAIMGPSGSGKSTLAHILGLLDIPTSGQYLLNQQDISHIAEDELSELRRSEIGFIFQQFHLLPRVSAKENVELPLLYSKLAVPANYSLQLLKLVNLDNRQHHRPNELSGGQQQRVAIARSLINHPRMIFADEPTGNLDSQSEKEILSSLKKLNEEGITVIMVTHEETIGKQAKRLIRMRDGMIISDERLQNISPIKLIHRPVKTQSAGTIKDYLEYFLQGYKTLMANKIRSGLSMLGILIGVAAVVAILALGEGARKSLEEQLSTLGSNLLVVRSGGRRAMGVTQDSGGAKLFIEDAQYLQDKLASIKAVSPQVDGRAQVSFENSNMSVSVIGVEANYPDIRNWKPMLGQFFSQEDDRIRQRVCLIGMTVQRELFKNRNPMGEIIKINKVSFKVIGVMSDKSSGGWRDQNSMIVVPLRTAMHRLLGKESVDSIDVMINSAEEIESAEKDIVDLLNERKKIPLSQRENALQVMNMADIQKMVEQSNKTMSLLLTSVAAISLLVGGIGIMNIMLVSVTERTKEIGLRKAVGAKRRDILIQFLTESIVLSVTGGVLGILLGWLITTVLSSLTGWSTSVSFFSVFISFVFSSLVGIVFGIYPALKASQLHPILALRHE
jgi:macrolide transport system ATP-binding/permease protein